MNQYHILSQENEITRLLKADRSAVRNFFDIKIEQNTAYDGASHEVKLDIIAGTPEFWEAHPDCLKKPGCKICVGDIEDHEYCKREELYCLSPSFVDQGSMLANFLLIYRSYLVSLSSAVQWRMYYKALISEPDPIIVTDKDGIIDFMNAKAELNLQVRLRNYKGVLFQSLFNDTPVIDLEAREALLDFYKGHKVSHTINEMNWVSDSGEHYPFSITLTRMDMDNLGESPVKIKLTDASGIHQMKEEIEVKEAALDQAENGVMITSADLENGPVIEYVNPKMGRITGYRPDELIGKTPSVLQGPETNREMLQRLKAELEKGKTFKAKAINYRKDKQKYYVEWDISPIRDRNGNIRHYVSIQNDISSELEKSFAYQRLATIVNHSKSAIFTLKKNGVVLSVNSGATKLLKIDEHEILGKNIGEFFEANNNLTELLSGLSADSNTKSFKGLDLYATDGRRISADGNAYYLENDSPDLINETYIALVIDDVTEVKRAIRVLEEASEKAHIGGWELDLRGQVVNVSEWVKNEFGFSHTSIPLSDLATNFGATVNEKVRRVFQQAEKKNQIQQVIQLPVSNRHYMITGQRESGSNFEIWKGLVQDVTEEVYERMRLEWRKQVTEKIAKGDSADKIYADINSYIEQEIKGAQSILTFFRDSRVYAAYTDSLEEYRSAILNSRIVEGAGPCSVAYHTEKPVIAPDISCIEEWSLFRNLVSKINIKASWSYPITIKGEVLGTLALFFKEERTPDREEEKIVESVQQLLQLLTEREEDRKNLLETTRKLETAQDIAGIGDWVLDIESERFTSLSKNLINIFQLNESYQTDKDLSVRNQEIVLSDIFDKIHEDDLGYVQDVIRDAVLNKTSFNVKYRIGPFENGAIRFHNSVGEYISEEGRTLLSGITRDITEEKEAEEKILENLEMWSSLVDTLPNPLLIIDDRDILFLNPAAQQLLGIADDVLDGSMMLYDYVALDDQKKLKRFLHSDEKGPEEGIQITLLNKNGKFNHVIVKSSKIIYEGRRLKQVVLSDITELIRIQTELQKMRDHLETRVQKRTEELSIKNKELQQEVEKRKGVEEELRHTSVQLTTIFNHSRQVILLLDSEFRILSFNRRAEAWSKNVINKPLEKYTPFTSYDTLGLKDDMQKRFRKALQGITSQAERRISQFDGPDRWAQIEYIPVWEDDDTMPEKVLFVATDVTERKRAEVELRENKKLLESINEHVSQGIFRLTPDRWAYANKAFLNIIGASDLEEIKEVSLADMYVNDGDYYKLKRKLAKQGGVDGIETKIKTLDGSVIDVLISIFMYKNKNGTIEYIDGTLTDISELKKSEKKLQESEERYRNLYENMSQGVVYHKPDGSIVNINDAACRILGQSREQLLGVSSLDPKWRVVNIHGDNLKGEDHPVMRAFREKREISNDMIGVYRPNDDEFRWLNVHAQPHFDEETGEPLNAVVTFEDITPLKRANEKVEEARKQTELMASAKEQFLANMSHEIRTPMSGIKGMAYLLNRTNLDEDQSLYVKNIIESSQNLLVIINDILDISKIESGKIHFEHSSFRIRNVVNSVSDMMRVQTGEHLNIVTEVEDDVPEYVIGDSSRLNQILFNLVGNAVKFTDKGYVTIKVSKDNDSGDGGSCDIRISVEDTGIGIAEEKLDTIFEIFTQVDGSSTKKYRGTGLGLHITKRLTELQGGEIEVISKLGVGSLFTVILPYTIDHQDGQTDTKEFNDVDLNGIEVLVVDDNAVNALWAKKLLQKWNVHVETAAGGLEAIDYLKKASPDVILMDIQMPEMNGYETTQFIRNTLDDYTQTPIIGVTADVLRNQMKKCRQAGMDTYIAKPYEPEEILKILKKYITMNRGDNGYE